MSSLFFAIILLLAGLGLVVLEVLLPSGGMISILAAAAFAGSLVLAFRESNGTGYVFLSVMLVCLPVSIGWAFRILPKTRIGKQMILTPTAANPEDFGAPGVSVEDFGALKGKTGVAITPLRPAGIALIDGQRYSVTAKGTLIEKDSAIVVEQVEGNNIIVELKNA